MLRICGCFFAIFFTFLGSAQNKDFYEKYKLSLKEAVQIKGIVTPGEQILASLSDEDFESLFISAERLDQFFIGNGELNDLDKVYNLMLWGPISFLAATNFVISDPAMALRRYNSIFSNAWINLYKEENKKKPFYVEENLEFKDRKSSETFGQIEIWAKLFGKAAIRNKKYLSLLDEYDLNFQNPMPQEVTALVLWVHILEKEVYSTEKLRTIFEALGPEYLRYFFSLLNKVGDDEVRKHLFFFLKSLAPNFSANGHPAGIFQVIAKPDVFRENIFVPFLNREGNWKAFGSLIQSADLMHRNNTYVLCKKSLREK